MFSCLARGVGSWEGEVALQEDTVSTPECRSAVSHLMRGSEVLTLPLNFHNGVHRHGITVSSQSVASRATTPRDHGELILPRTFTTRKGALMLFADDMQVDYAHCKNLLSSAKMTKTRIFQEELEKLGSLARLSSTALMFGDQDYDSETCSVSDPKNKVFLKFLKHLDGVDADLNVQPGGNANDYLRNLRHRLIRAKLKSGERRNVLEDGNQGRLVQSMSSIPQLRSPDHLPREGSQVLVLDRLTTEFPKKLESQKLGFPSVFSALKRSSETAVPPDLSSLSTSCKYDQTFQMSEPLHPLSDTCQSQSLPLSSVLLPEQSQNISQRQSLTGPDVWPPAEHTNDEQSVIQSYDSAEDEESDDLNTAYDITMLHDYHSQDYYESGERRSPEVKDQDDLKESDLIQPLMPAYDTLATYCGLPSVSKSFPHEESRIQPSPPLSARSVGAKLRGTIPRASVHVSSGTSQPRNHSATGRISRQSSTSVMTAREIKSAGQSSQSSGLSVSNSGSGLKEIRTDHSISRAATSEKKSEVAETKAPRTGEEKNFSNSLRISRLKTPGGREKKRKVATVRKGYEEEARKKIADETEDPDTSLPQEDFAEPAQGEMVETMAAENGASSTEVKIIPSSARRKSKKTKGARTAGEDNGLLRKLDVDKAAVREARRKEAELKKLLTEERLAEEKWLAEDRRLAEERRLEEEEKLVNKHERDKEDVAALAEREAKMQEEIAEARRKAEEAREAEDAARNALAATWKAAREHREEQRRANIERRKQELMEQNRKEQERINNAKRKEQEMLERIGSAEELKQFCEAERLCKEEMAHAQMLQLEEEERLATIAFEKEEERYLNMEREAEEAAMAKLVQERFEAEQRPGKLKEKQRRLQSEGSRKKSALLAEEQQREESLRKLQEEQDQKEEEARQKLLEIQRLQEEAVESTQRNREMRRSAALQRRGQNIQNRMHLESLRHDQTNLSQPWTFSYYIHWPRETYAKLMGQDPRKKSGFRSPIKHYAKK